MEEAILSVLMFFIVLFLGIIGLYLGGCGVMLLFFSNLMSNDLKSILEEDGERGKKAYDLVRILLGSFLMLFGFTLIAITIALAIKFIWPFLLEMNL
ncbi:hypothetical protein IJG20_01960 [Candidatus Saccharibacteria bacterium]|nr:hypothetical protein [Candidatus Saccharibacteria bacterium]